MELPELVSSRVAETVEGSDADEIEHFGGIWVNARIEIIDGEEL